VCSSDLIEGRNLEEVVRGPADGQVWVQVGSSAYR